MANPFLSQDYRLWILMTQTRDTMWAVREKEVAEYGLSNVETATLFIIQAIGLSIDRKATPLEISRWLFRKPHSVSELLKRMEKKGLVTKAKDLERKNSVRVAVTEKGRKAYKKVTRQGRAISRMMSTLSEEEHHQLWSCLGKLREKALDEFGTKYRPPFPQFLKDPYAD